VEGEINVVYFKPCGNAISEVSLIRCDILTLSAVQVLSTMGITTGKFSSTKVRSDELCFNEISSVCCYNPSVISVLAAGVALQSIFDAVCLPAADGGAGDTTALQVRCIPRHCSRSYLNFHLVNVLEVDKEWTNVTSADSVRI